MTSNLAQLENTCSNSEIELTIIIIIIIIIIVIMIIIMIKKKYFGISILHGIGSSSENYINKKENTTQ